MKKTIALIVIALFSSNSIARVSIGNKYQGEYYCNLYQITNNNCVKGDLIVVSIDGESIIALYCDFQYTVYTTGGGVVCTYLGYRREKRR